MSAYQMCNRCVMDNYSDITITFDEKGYCNYCTESLRIMPGGYYPNEKGERLLSEMLKRIKIGNVSHQYDCLMGLSGGLDSSYLAYLGAVKWGLRILAVHIDDGFDEPVAKENLQKLCKSCQIEMIVEKPDKEQFLDLTRSFLLAEVPNLAIPQDNILFACLYDLANKYHIHTFLSGTNFALESVLQRGNTHDSSDATHIRAIHRHFGRKPIDKLPLLSAYKKIQYRYIDKIETIRPLNYIDYNRDRAIQQLKDFCGYQYYESKHLENKLTKFIQLYWFYNKFGVEKRRSHLSSLIVSGQMTREQALEELALPMYNEAQMEADIKEILMQLDISKIYLDEIMSRKGVQHAMYPTSKFNRLLNYSIKMKKSLTGKL